MDPVSVVALVGFGLQAADTIKKLLDFLDQVRDAPNSVERLKSELQIIEGIVSTTIEDDKQKLEDASERTSKAYQKALEAVSQQCQALLTLLEKTLAKQGMSRRKRLLNSLNYVFREEEFTKLVEDLERAKSSFQLAQLCITNESSARNSRLLQQTNLQLYALTQAIIQNGDLSAVSDASDLSIAAWKMLSLGSTNNGTGALKRVERQSSESTKPAQKPQQPFSPSTKESLATDLAFEPPPHEPTGTALDTSASETAGRPGPSSSLIELYPGGFAYVKLQDRFSILKTKTEVTMFHSPLLGTVVVTRRKTATKNWNTETQQYETEQEGVRTSIKIRPAPWLFSTAYEIRAEQIMSRYGSSNLSIVLEPLRYTRITHFLNTELGDLIELQTFLTERKFSIKDRDEGTGGNLLSLYLDALRTDWFYAECNPQEEIAKNSHRANIVRTCRWLVSQGLTYDFEADDPFINGILHFDAPLDQYDTFRQVQEYESLLLESTDSAPCLQRAKMLLSFGLSNPDHSQQLKSKVVDLIQEAAVDHGPEVLAAEEERFWADQDIINHDIASVIASSMLQLARIPKASMRTMRRTALKGPRRFFYRVLTDEAIWANLETRIQSQDGTEGDIAAFANFLGSCRSLALLSDGFGEHLFRVIRKNEVLRDGLLEFWRATLRKANYDPDYFENPERSTINPKSSHPPSPEGVTDRPWRLGESSETSEHLPSAQPGDKIPPWTDLDAVTEYFTSLELGPDPSEDPQPPEVQSKSLVSRIATVGLEFVTSTV